MKRFFTMLLAGMLLGATLSGCIIWPGWWDEGGHRGGHEHHGGGWEHGDRR